MYQLVEKADQVTEATQESAAEKRARLLKYRETLEVASVLNGTRWARARLILRAHGYDNVGGLDAMWGAAGEDGERQIVRDSARAYRSAEMKVRRIGAKYMRVHAELQRLRGE